MKAPEPWTITIDGPAGSGKSTVAKALAAELGVTYLNTGAMYRAVALACQRGNIAYDQQDQVTDLLQTTTLAQVGDRIILNGTDETETLDAYGTEASKIAVFPYVRTFLVNIQQQIGQQQNLVSDGRDQGTVVFPNAALKFYIIATAEVRAERRLQKLKLDGRTADFEQLRLEFIERDCRDMTRSAGPLVRPRGATVICTDHYSETELLNLLLKEVRACCLG
ncbi:MAG: (d)CMP kinase [Zavarzinella sp.]